MPTDVVDIFNYATGTWSTSQLSVPRMLFAASTVGKYPLFGGGCNYDSTALDIVNIFDAEAGQSDEHYNVKSCPWRFPSDYYWQKGFVWWRRQDR